VAGLDRGCPLDGAPRYRMALVMGGFC